MFRRTVISSFAVAAIAGCIWAVNPPVQKDSYHFAIIGDSGTGDRYEYQIAAQVARARETFPFQDVVMLGDNLYGGEKPRDYEAKFEKPYGLLLEAGVKFHASLGNHDDPSQVNYKYFNMNGQRYYTFRPHSGVRFFALDSTYIDRRQLEWLERELKASESEWKICFFHHPLYSSGDKHGPSMELRAVLEPLFVKYGVDLVLSGHEHFYERIKPQRGIYYFISGSAAKLREGNINRSEITAKAFDRGRAFMLMEITPDQLYFQTIGASGETIDQGVLPRLTGARRESPPPTQ